MASRGSSRRNVTPSAAEPLRIIFASTNPGKAREVGELLGGRFEVVTPPMWIGDVETGETYLENARLKAQCVFRMTGQAVLAEDSGLEVDALGGLPGLRSARFRTPQERGKAKVIRLLDGVPDAERKARFRAVGVLILPTGREFVGEGVVEGRIATAPRGSGGFGYDPIFIPEFGDRTAAELGPEEKNAISHRARALTALVAQLERA
jgi:XTP/dITP diphosphohydrolase